MSRVGRRGRAAGAGRTPGLEVPAITKFYYHDTAGQKREDWEKACPANEYRVLPPTALSGLVPAGLLAKADSVLVVASGSPQGTVMYMANVNRVDAKASGV